MLKVVAGGVSDGQLLVGDRIRAINDRLVESYQQTLAVLRDSGPQVTIDVLRRGRIGPILPIGMQMIRQNNSHHTIHCFREKCESRNL